MGSDLSFEDLTNRDIEDYEYVLLEENASCNNNSNGCYKLLSKPKDISTEYSKHITWVTKDHYLAIKEESYDQDEQLLKLKNIKFKKINEYYIMNELFVENIQKNHSTLLTIDEINLNLGFKDDLFHTKTLKRIPQD